MRLSASSIANTVRMHRQLFNGAILLVEGGIDARFVKQLIDRSNCMAVVANGRANVIDALRMLNNEAFKGVLAIVDADLDPLLGNMPAVVNLLTYDFRDVEIMLLHSPALDKILNEFGSEEKIQQFEAKEEVNVRTALLNRAGEVGFLRLLSYRDQLGLDFHELVFSRFVDAASLSLDVRRLVETVRNHSQVYGLSIEELV